MNMIKRSMTYIKRQFWKNALLFGIVFLLGILASGAVALSTAINNIHGNFIRNMRPIVTTQVDHGSWNDYWFKWFQNYGSDWESMPVFEHLSLDHIRAIGALEYVQDFNYTTMNRLFSSELKTVEEIDADPDYFPPIPGDFQPISVLGLSHADKMMQIEHGYLELINGIEFQNEHFVPGQDTSAAMISQAFANENKLNIGDTFNLYELVAFPVLEGELFSIEGWGRYIEEIYERVEMQFEIIGIFDIPTDSEADTIGVFDPSPRRDNINRIFVPVWATEDIFYRSSDPRMSVWGSVGLEIPYYIYETEGAVQPFIWGSNLPVFQLYSPLDIDVFYLAANSLLPAHHYFVDFSFGFDVVSAPLQTFQSTANWILFGSALSSIVLLGLLILLFLRDRKKEIGIYLALGEKKIKIILQFMVEGLIVTMFAITFSIIVGHFLSNEISHTLLQSELTSQFEQRDLHYTERYSQIRLWTSFDRVGISHTSLTVSQIMEAFDVSMSLINVGMIYSVSIVVLSFSMGPYLWIIMKRSPNEILNASDSK